MSFRLAYVICFSLADRVVEARRSRFVEEKFLRLATTTLSSDPQVDVPVEYEYRSVGCWIPSKLDHKIEDTEPTVAMAVDSCFIFCKRKHEELVDFLGMYFGITKGDKCWCASTYDGVEKPDECTTACTGGGPGCGGAEAANIYYMYARNASHYESEPETLDMVKDLAPKAASLSDTAAQDLSQKLPATAQHADFNGDGFLDAHEITHAFHARFYVLHEGSTCGQGDPVKIHGQETLVAKLVDCQMTCILSKKCGGFTLDTSLRQCAFYADVQSGSTESGEQYVCYNRVLI